MIIDVDVGNTRIKWRSSEAPERLIAHQTFAEAQSAWAALPSVARFRVAAVVDPRKVEQFSVWAGTALGVAPELAVVKRQLLGLTIAYADPGTLGVDRWLAMLAARERFSQQDVILMSAGTALTFDYLDARGQHRGGYIMPGWRLTASALLAGTDRVRCVEPEILSAATPADSTQGCVNAGFSLFYRAAIEAALVPALDNFNAATLLVTGGDGQSLAGLQRTELRCVYDPLLVLRGLTIALP